MSFQPNFYFFCLSLTAVICGAIAWIVGQQRHLAAASRPFAGMMLAIAGYALFAALESAAVTLPEKIFWSKLEYLGSGSVITLFLIFAIRFTQKPKWLGDRRIALLWIIPLLNLLLVATNERHHLVWTGFSVGSPGSNMVIYHHGIGFFWIMFWIYVYVLWGTLLLIQTAWHSGTLYRQQSSMMIAGAALPLLGSSFYMLGLTPPGLNITPLSFMLTGVIYFISLFRFRMFDLVPVARDTLVESMVDGVIVLDLRHRLIDLNPAAQRLTGLTPRRIGQSVATVLTQWFDLTRLCAADPDFRTEALIQETPLCYVEVQASSLRDRHGKATGRLIILRDITKRYQAELKLRQANQQLQTQLQEIQTLQVQLREQANRDSLTGLFNRRYFEAALDRALDQALRTTKGKYPIAIVLLDIDYFKQVNDTYGHKAGDRMLQAFAGVLQSQVRSYDIACRYGGEEFAIALPGVSLDLAYERADQIRAAFATFHLEWEGQEVYTTVSSGIAMFPEHGKTIDELLQFADQGLYAAKASGRNCVCVTDIGCTPDFHSVTNSVTTSRTPDCSG